MTGNFTRFRHPAMLYFLTCLVGVALIGCTKTATDDGNEKYPRFTGAGAWSVNGITAGQTLLAVEAARGKPNTSKNVATPPVFVWPDDVTVSADANLTAKTVYGYTLNIGEAKVISGELNSAQVQQILGDGTKKVFRSPRGSGVISTGYVVRGASLTYARNGAYFVFTFDKNDRLTGIRTQLTDPNKR